MKKYLIDTEEFNEETFWHHRSAKEVEKLKCWILTMNTINLYNQIKVLFTLTSKAKILFVSVPNFIEEISKMFIHDKESMPLALMIGFSPMGFIPITIPQGNWTILNTLDEVTEDEAALIAEIDPEIDFENLPVYKDYDDTPTFYVSPRRSIQSLATSLGVEGKTIILYELK